MIMQLNNVLSSHCERACLQCNTLAVGGSYFDADKVCRTFANVIVDVVSWGAADQSLAYVTPHRIHAALVQLAGVCRQTLVYVY